MSKLIGSRGYGIRIAALFSAYFLGFGVYLPFIPVWLDAQGLSKSEIGVILAAPLIRVFVGPWISLTADRFEDRRVPIVALCSGTLLGFALLAVMPGFWGILAVAVFIATWWTSIMPLADTTAMNVSRDHGLDYGRMRLWGSLAFIVGSLGAGTLLGSWHADAVLWMIIVCQALLVTAALCLPPLRVSDESSDAKPVIADISRLLLTPRFVVFLMAAGLCQATHAMYYVFGTLHWRTVGIPDLEIGILWSVGVLAEIVLFAFSGRFLQRLPPAVLIVVGALVSVVRWGLMAVLTDFSVLLAVQILHAATFGAVHLGTMHFIANTVPRNMQVTAQGLYAAVSAGLLMSGAAMASGPIFAHWGANGFLVMSGVGAVALLLAALFWWRWPGGDVSPKERLRADT